MINKDAGRRIKELRISNNYTRECFAEKVGISPKFLYEIESGKKGFSTGILEQIATVLKVSTDYILTGKCSNNSFERVMRLVESFDDMQLEKVQDILEVLRDIYVSK